MSFLQIRQENGRVINGNTPYKTVTMFTFVEDSLLVSFSVRFDLSSFYSRFTSKQWNVCLYFQLTTHLASCREIGNCDIKVVQKQLVDPVDINFLVCVPKQYPNPWCETFKILGRYRRVNLPPAYLFSQFLAPPYFLEQFLSP